MRIYCRSGCMCVHESFCGKCRGYGSVIGGSSVDPLSCGSLSLESAEIVTAEITRKTREMILYQFPGFFLFYLDIYYEWRPI
jgi:hypothetical protein